MQRQHFVAEASRILAESIDSDAALQAVAQLVVPGLADWCVIDLVRDDGSMARVAVAPRDRTREFCHTLLKPSRLRLLRRLGLHACLSRPLRARGRVLGILSVFAEGARAFDAADVAMAEELARLAALAIDNARLREEVQRTTRARDEVLAVVTRELRMPLAAILAAEAQLAVATSTSTGQALREAAASYRRAALQMCRLIDGLAGVPETLPHAPLFDDTPMDESEIVEWVAKR